MNWHTEVSIAFRLIGPFGRLGYWLCMTPGAAVSIAFRLIGPFGQVHLGLDLLAVRWSPLPFG